MNKPPMITAKALGAMPQFALEHLGARALDRVLAATSLPHRFVEERDGFIPKAMLAGFVEQVGHAAGKKGIGLLWAPHLTVADYGAWGAYVLAAPDLGQALARAQKVMPFHSSVDFTDFGIEGDLASYSYHFGLKDHGAYESIAYSAAGSVLSIFRHYLGNGWKPARIHFDLPRPINAGDVEATFGCPIRWNSPSLTIVFPRELLTIRRFSLRSASATIEDIARERRAGPPARFSDIVANVIRLHLESDRISVDSAARSLDLGVRTLQRRLRDENLSFRELSNQVVMGRALELLRAGQATVGIVATELGYNTPNNFSRAFRDWYGVPPTEHGRIGPEQLRNPN